MNDDLIAALELAADAVLSYARTSVAERVKASCAISQHIADLRAGNLVRREDAVAQLRALRDQAPPQSQWFAAATLADRYEQFGNFLSENHQPQRAIEAGAHEE